MSVASSTIDTAARASLWLQPHRIGLILIALAAFAAAALLGRWDWLPQYLPRLGWGILVTLAMLFGSAILGFLLAVPLGLVQVTGPAWVN